MAEKLFCGGETEEEFQMLNEALPKIVTEMLPGPISKKCN